MGLHSLRKYEREQKRGMPCESHLQNIAVRLDWKVKARLDSKARKYGKPTAQLVREILHAWIAEAAE